MMEELVSSVMEDKLSLIPRTPSRKRTVAEPSKHLVHHTFTDRRQIDRDRDPERGEDRRVTNARQFKDLWAVDGAA